jgi:glycosyltransferase involved in cell wall biosynthesis
MIYSEAMTAFPIFKFLASVLKRVYISVINDLATDQRVGRVASLLSSEGFEVCCIGRKLKNSPRLVDMPYKLRRYRMLFSRGPQFYAFYNLRLLVTLLFAKKPSLYISNDLDTLPANMLASRIRRVTLIYDSHELFTQVPELIDRKAVQSVWKFIEARLLPRLEYAVTVNYSIATIYRRLYGTRFKVVRNMPEKQEYLLRDVLEKDRFQIIYQGALNVGRGLELMVDAMQFIDNAVFILAGTGDIHQELIHRVGQKGLGERVKFMGRMMPADLVPLTRSSDLGISLEEDRGLNYRYALPNKIFDYIQCRVPVLCSGLPEMSRIVETYGIGISTAERDPEQLAGIIRYMLKERSGGAWMKALETAAAELCWENESRVYLDLLHECGALPKIP